MMDSCGLERPNRCPQGRGRAPGREPLSSDRRRTARLAKEAALSIFIDQEATAALSLGRRGRSSASLLNERRAARCWMRSCLSLRLLMLHAAPL